MPWTKTGDTAATYPPLLAVDGHPSADDWSLNEVAGFVLRLFVHCAAHMRDYIVEFPEAKLMGNGRHEILIEQASAAGLMTHLDGEGRARRWTLVRDPEFVHLRLRAEVLFDRQRDQDRRNPDLTMPVRRRDGDACRYCTKTVSWTDRKSGRGGTLDHREPGKAAEIDTYVVSCRSCNSKRKASENADEEIPLLPPPAVPYYSDSTRKLLDAYYGPEDAQRQRPDPTQGPALAPTTEDAPPAPRQRPDPTQGPALAPTTEPAPRQRPEQPALAPTTEEARPERRRRNGTQPNDAPTTEHAPPAPRQGPDPTQGPALAPTTECNETIKPAPDLRGIYAERSGTRVDAGSGRDGTGLGLEGRGRAGPGQVGRQPRSSRTRSRKRSRKPRTPPETGQGHQ